LISIPIPIAEMISLVSLLQIILVLATLNLSPTSALPIAQDPTSAFSDLEDRDVSYMQSRLFPLGGYPSKSAWTTSTALSDRFNLQAGIPINKGGKPPQGHAPDGKGAIISFFPQGSINPGNKQAPKGGMSWYTSGPHWGSVFTKGTGSWEDDLTRAKEITFGYSVMFENGFQFNKGGKLPGVYGGVSEEEAVGCSGGRQEGRDGCFSSRLMWRECPPASILSFLLFILSGLAKLTHLPSRPSVQERTGRARPTTTSPHPLISPNLTARLDPRVIVTPITAIPVSILPSSSFSFPSFALH
jgi:hypothetical protein